MYGLKSSVAAFRAFHAERLDEMGLKSSIADLDVWVRPATKLYGEQYYKFILVYIDNLLLLVQDAVSVIREVACTTLHAKGIWVSTLLLGIELLKLV